MKLHHRRKFLHLAAGAAALPAVSRFAWAQTYPTRPVRIIAGFPPGSASDVTARLLGQWLSERLGQSFIVENRLGAARNLAAQAVVRALADGYTLLHHFGQRSQCNALRRLNQSHPRHRASGKHSSRPGVMVVADFRSNCS